MSRELRKKTIYMVLAEIICIVLLGWFLVSVQTRLIVNNDKTDLMENLNQIEVSLQESSDASEMTKANYDDVYISQAESVAYMAQKQEDFEYTTKKMQYLANLLEVNNVYVLDSAGNTVAGSSSGIDFTVPRYNQLRTVFNSSEPSEPFDVTIGEEMMRYYGARINENAMVVVQNDPEELNTTLEEMYSLSENLNGVSVGMGGYPFAVSSLSYTFLEYPDEALIGQDALSCGLTVDELSDGYTGWMEINGSKVYGAVKLIDDTYVVCAVPIEEIAAARNLTVVVTLLAFFAVITTVIVYGTILRLQNEFNPKNRADQYKKVGPFYFNKENSRKLFTICGAGLVCVLIISIFMQTLFSVSNQSVDNRQPLDTLEKTISKNDKMIDYLTESYNKHHLNKCQILVEILDKNPELINKEDLVELKNMLRVDNAWVIGADGKTIATSSVYWDFEVSDDEESRSYEFHDLLKGYKDYLVQAPKKEWKSDIVSQFIGVTLRDEEGMSRGFVEVSVLGEQLDRVLNNTEVDSMLKDIQVGTHGFVFAVNKEDNTFAYYPDEKYIGKGISDYGMSESDVKDDFSDFITIGDTKYYCSSMETDDYVYYVAVPKTEMNRYCTYIAVITVIASLIALLIVSLILLLSREIPDCDLEEEQRKNTSDFIDVKLSDGRIKRTTAAASRWGGRGSIEWSDKTPEQKLLTFINGVVTCIAILMLVVILFRERIFAPDSIIHYVLAGNWEKGINIFTITNVIIIFVIANIIAAIVRKLLRVVANLFGARGETVCRLLDNIIKYGTILCLLYYCLGLFGMDTKTLVASAGIMSLVIGLGAQSLISDILAGLFIVFEGEFRVGDIVTIGDWRGTVLEIGVRTTKIEDPSKNIKIINNSNVTGVINMTKQYSFASCDVGIDYGESLEHVESVLQKELPNVKERVPSIVDGPFYKGVVSLADSSVVIRLVAQCAEGDRVQLGRDLNREVKLIFDKHNISIPFPQIVLNQPSEYETATYEEKRQSDNFVKEQKEKSKEIGIDEEEH